MITKAEEKQERRRAVRREIQIPCKTSVGEHEGAEVCELYTRDVSHTGAFIKTDQPFPLASEIKMMLDLGKTMVKAIGEVVRVEAEGMAIAFLRTEVAPVRVQD